MYPRSLLCEEAKIEQRTLLKKKLCKIGEKAIWESRFTYCLYLSTQNSSFFTAVRRLLLCPTNSQGVNLSRPFVRTWPCTDLHLLHKGEQSKKTFIESTCSYISCNFNNCRGATHSLWRDFPNKLIETLIIILRETSKHRCKSSSLLKSS